MATRVAVAGAGYFADFHLQAWQALGVPVAGVADRDAARAETVARRFGAQDGFTTPDDLLDRTGATLLDIVLPPQAHDEWVRAALQRKIPVICQKPFGVNLAQAKVLAELAEAQQTPLVVHENFRFAPWFRECRRLIVNNHFGRLHGVSFRLRPGDGQGARAYLDRQPYFQELERLLVRETAVHYIDSFRFLMGEVRAVTARLRKLNPVIAGEDAGIVIFEFDDARQGLFDGNRLNDHVADNTRLTMGEMWLEGEAGVMRLDGDGRLWWKAHGRPELEHPYARTGTGPFGGAVIALQRHVLAHLGQGSALENSATEYLANLRVQEAIYLSHASGRRVVMAEFDLN